MTYDDAIAVLRERWRDGSRDVVMSPELYDAYESGIVANLHYVDRERDPVACAYCGRSNPLGNQCAGCGASRYILRTPEPILWFKNMRVRRAA